MKDQYGRQIHYLRLSVTDKCNLRCRYCMPTGMVACTHSDVLSYEEMVKTVEVMAELGIDTIRVTGGEPLLRADVEVLIKKLKHIPGIRRVGMTTNGILLKDKLPVFINAGMDSVNISLDTLQDKKFEEITGFALLPKVLESIESSVAAGLRVKINCVPQKSVNEEELAAIAALAKNMPIEVRFIEMMPLGQGKMYTGIDNRILQKTMCETFGVLEQIPKSRQMGVGPAVSYKVPGFQGRIGFISAIHGKFCEDCNRVRMTAEGFIKGCLASKQGLDVRKLIREQVPTEELKRQIWYTVYHKPMEHHFECMGDTGENRDMYKIGG